MFLATVFAVSILCGVMDNAIEWTRLPDLPCTIGLAGPMVGVSHGVLIVAGGANFPGKMPWEGGKKVWHDDIYVLRPSDGKMTWETMSQRLPRPLGYGVSLTYGDAIICVGGSNAERHFAECFKLEWKEDRLTTTMLPALPRPMANGCGVMVGLALFVIGGQEKPTSSEASSLVYSLDLASPTAQWRQEPPLPGSGRILAVAAGCGDALFVVGGASLSPMPNGVIQRTYLKDGYRFRSDQGWKQIADLPWPLAASPSPAPVHAGGFFVLGGDDGVKSGCAFDQHSGFNSHILRFDLASEHWVDAGTWSFPSVTTCSVRLGDRWIIPGGEIRPGVRSPKVWAAHLRQSPN